MLVFLLFCCIYLEDVLGGLEMEMERERKRRTGPSPKSFSGFW